MKLRDGCTRLQYRDLLNCLIAIGLLLVAFSTIQAQTTVGTGSVTGTVNDPTGAVVSAAVITITNTATNAVVRLTSNSSGAYTSGALTPGFAPSKLTSF